MKIVYITDTHDMGRNPGSRTDDYHSAIYAKMSEAVDAAINMGAIAFIHGGDWFNFPKVSNIIYNQHQRLLRKLQANNIPVYVVPGNHDLYGYSMTTIDQTSIGSFAEAGLVKLLTRDKPHVLPSLQDIVVIYGREYSSDIDTDPLNDYEINHVGYGDKHLLFSHGMLLDKPFHPDVRHTLTKDVSTQADYVFNGHYHPGWPEHKIHDTWFYNNGSTGRNEGSKGNLTFKPAYTVIEYDGPTDEIHVKRIPYKCAAKGTDVFDRSRLVEQKALSKSLDEFQETLDDVLDFDSYDPKDIILNTKPTSDLTKEILEEAFELVSQQEQDNVTVLSRGFNPSLKPVYIESLHLVNFESHKDTTIEFSPKGITSITGTTDSGKSSIVRAIRFVVSNEPKGSDFIRYGQKRASVRMKMSNGYEIVRTRTNSSAGEYIVIDPSGVATDFKGFGNDIPIEVLNAHQMPKVELATGVNRSLNTAFQLDGHFMLSDSPLQRAAAIGRLTGVHLVDGAIKKNYADILSLSKDTKVSETIIQDMDSKIASLDWIKAKEMSLTFIEGLIIGAKSFESELNKLTSLSKERNLLRSRVSMYEIDLEGYDHLPVAEAMLNNADRLLLELSTLKNMDESYYNLAASIDELEGKVGLIDIDTINDDFTKVDDIIKELSIIKPLHRDLTLYSSLEKESQRLIDSSVVDKVSLLIDKADKERDELEALKAMYYAYNDGLASFNMTQEAFNSAQEFLLDAENNLFELIEEIGNTCPLCNQTIKDKTILKHSH